MKQADSFLCVKRYGLLRLELSSLNMAAIHHSPFTEKLYLVTAWTGASTTGSVMQPIMNMYSDSRVLGIEPLLPAALAVEAGRAVNMREPLIRPRWASNLAQSLPRRARQIVAHGVSFSVISAKQHQHRRQPNPSRIGPVSAHQSGCSPAAILSKARRILALSSVSFSKLSLMVSPFPVQQ